MTASSDSPDWRGGKSTPRPRTAAASPRRKKILTLAAVMLAVIGVVIGLVLWFRPLSDPFFLAGWVDQYESP